MSAVKAESLWTRRKMLARVALGSTAGLILAACGGGGGGDDSSGDARALRNAFANLREGMKWTDVEALVGFPANDWRTPVDLRWIVNGLTLYVGFYSGTRDVSNATLTEPDGVTKSYWEAY